MDENQQSLETLQDIKRMMERSSRFISLSGLSGIAAGACALVGAWFAHDVISANRGLILGRRNFNRDYDLDTIQEYMGNRLFQIAVITFVAALMLAFFFTWLRSKKDGVAIWGSTAKRVLFAVTIPLIAGGIYLLREIEIGSYGLIAPGSLIFYGLALVNASKYTLGEVKYLGYCQIILGIINCWMIGYGLYFWALGFGVLHIIYGAYMWFKYERAS
ncbi:MAG: hypothetical protein ABIN36_16885 [Ferruginibacter sp.]